ncbi:Pyruvate decarboxylase [Paramyrothecium foliicola]|nr:Pyruvate decarboxylase [Paramyrothecium foliicola]
MMSKTVTVAEYLFQRLRQLGVGAIHGVPGDFNLTLLDYVEPTGLLWVGNANELNAAYAADGYARIKGLGAVVTTFGVGELSAINAIAGAYAERAAVVHIVGVPARPAQENRTKVHHTFNDGNFTRFAEMQRHVTVAQTKLWDPRTSAEQIDGVLQECLLHSRPVYIEVPVDVVDIAIPSQRLDHELKAPTPVLSPSYNKVLEDICTQVRAARKPAIIVDGEIRAMGIVDPVQSLVSNTGWPTWVTGFAKGLLDESPANYHGIFRGKYDTPESRNFLDEADLVLLFGPHQSSTNTFLYTSIPEAKKTISFRDTDVSIGAETIRDIPASVIVPQIVHSLSDLSSAYTDDYPSLPKDQLLSFGEVSGEEAITQNKLWRLLANFFRPGDIILGETGTAGYGVRDVPLPKNSRLFSPVTWLSIGYMLPAAQGAALAQKELMTASKYHGMTTARTVLLIGDGSFQMTVQELSTMIQHNLNVVVFLINNDGYTIERCIHGLDERYNDVARWRYLRAPQFFGAAEDAFTGSARTWGELGNVLEEEKLKNGTGLRMVEVFMERDDAPPGPLSQYLETERQRVAKISID